VPGINWGDALHNWLFAGLGTLVGAAIFVAGACWYLYARPDDEVHEAGGVREDASGDGRQRDPRFAGASSQPSG
jgi:hypothetical protein